MRSYFIAFVCLVSMWSCKPKIESAKSIEDEAFTSYTSRFDDQLWQVFPESGQWNGYHAVDSMLTIVDSLQLGKQLAFAATHQDSLRTFVFEKLTPNQQTDYKLIETALSQIEWQIKEEKAHVWNPSNYNVCGLFSDILDNNYDSLENRLANFSFKLNKVPAYYAAAKANIVNPTLEHTLLAISQNESSVSVFDEDLKAALLNTKWTEAQKAEIIAKADKAKLAVLDYVKWLKELKNSNPKDFRLGSELYEKKFKYEIQSRYSAQEVLVKALERKKYLHQKMNELADQLWPKYFGNTAKPDDNLLKIKLLIAEISKKHISADSFQLAIEKQIPDLTNFVKQKNLLYLDSTKPLVVRKEPAYMAGVAGASISSPGPYNTNGNTYYNVGSLAKMGKEEAESYLREYNYYILQILNIHEAIPGHYAQLVYSNKAPSIIKSILGNGTMIEGWAVYSELMMLENGYGNNEPEMWLMYYKWNLRSVCNTILDIGVHTNNLSKKEAIHLLVDEAFQQSAEAENKWKRATLTQVQLCSYFTGFTEICELREEIKKREGQNFDLKTFHESFLSYGSAPVQFIRELMLARK